MQLTWTGEVQHVASVAPHPQPLLAGALADSLLLLRSDPASGGQEVRQSWLPCKGCHAHTLAALLSHAAI